MALALALASDPELLILDEPLAMPASRRPVRFTPQWPPFLFGEATLARQALERDADSELQLQRYRKTMELIDTLVDRLRRSWRLFEQDGADLIEIWLVRELMRPDARHHLGDELFEQLVHSLGDGARRYAARRRALVMSWARYRHSLRTNSPANQLGGYWWIGESGSGASGAPNWSCSCKALSCQSRWDTLSSTAPLTPLGKPAGAGPNEYL